MRTFFLVTAAAAAAFIAISASASPPPISMQTARARALAAVPHGRIGSAELEREQGRLIYSFDIRVPGRAGVEEVQISALTGRLISRRHESPAAERREARNEARERRRR
ncbi:MAG: hypothetical protein QOG13_2022 [Sphingomonadales bacterium]|jgi:hypothetical protein|nr:hypothetical protein [Sphingomonadales bacterium]MEA3044926.1 hypothetical protein [Sphingomonadales bacterium]